MAYNDGKFVLLENATATGSAVAWPGGPGVFSVLSTAFTGATIKLQWSPDDTTYIDADAAGSFFTTLSANGAGRFDLPSCYIKAVVTGGPPTAAYAYASTVPF